MAMPTTSDDSDKINTRCCIAGGGPAGMMLGFLLARAGIDVAVLEKHADFLRDFRGDTVHPSTLEVLYELGLLEGFLKRKHQEVRQLSGYIGPYEVPIADLSHLPTHCKFVALMPQWDFLNFMAESAERYPGFHLMMESEAFDLIEEGGKIRGLRAKTKRGEIEIRADLTIAADGRHSLMRERAGLEVMQLGAPIDVLWMRISRKSGDPGQVLGRIDAGKFLVMLDRDEYWQCAFLIPKGGLDELREKGLASFREDIARYRTVPSRSSERTKGLGRHQTTVRRSGPAAPMVSSGIAVHRRCGSRDVSRRRCGDQPGHTRRGGRRQYSRRPAFTQLRLRTPSRKYSEAPHVSHTRHTASPNLDSESSDRAHAKKHD